jgi:hypothetical protein
MSDINVISRMQKIIVDAASNSVSVINIGPQGPGFWQNGVPYTVSGGTTGTQPTFSGTPLFTGYKVQMGQLIYFQINVEFDNITSFGTGQYYVSIPYNTQNGFMTRGGCLHDASTNKQYSIGGHVNPGSNLMYLSYVGSNGHDDEFDHNSPVTLTTADSFHISGWYLKQNNN